MGTTQLQPSASLELPSTPSSGIPVDQGSESLLIGDCFVRGALGAAGILAMPDPSEAHSTPPHYGASTRSNIGENAYFNLPISPHYLLASTSFS